MDTLNLPAAAVSLIPLVMALTALSKVYISSRYAPVVALLLGIGGMFLLPIHSVPETLLSGIVVGLTASGLYSGGKATFRG